jgi:replication-associated recombination protein RarA
MKRSRADLRAAVARELERRKLQEQRKEREEEELHAWRQQEQPTGAEARLRSLRDEAFELVRRNSSNNPGAALMRRELARRFPDVSSDEYAQVYFDLFDECQKLLWGSGEVAALYWDERLSQAGALRQLQERFPGFSVRTYEAAFSEGMKGIR